MKKLLIFEDDASLGEMYRIKFTKKGFEVKVAPNGQNAVSEVINFGPDVVLLDLLMPKKDGFAVLEELKREAKTANVPVIVSSNLGQDSDVEKAMGLGAVEYIIKSNMNLDEIVERIEKVGS